MSLWTVAIADSRNLLDAATKSLIDTDLHYVIDYLDRFIDWKGTLDVQVNIKTYEDLKAELGWDFDGISPATEMSWFSNGSVQNKSNLIELLTGEDKNGAQPDAGFTIYLGKDGTIRNYGRPVWLDPDPVFHASAPVPAGQHDFVSIALHEVLHTLAFDQANYSSSTLGSKVTLKDGVYYFAGEATVALLGQPLAFDAVGHVISSLTPAYAQSGMMSDVGHYEQNRWDIGRIELAVMQDLGFDVHLPLHGLSYTDLDDKRPMVGGTDGGDVLYGDFHDNSMYGLAGNDVFEGGAGNDRIDGGAGLDTALYAGNAASFDVALTSGGITVSDKSGAEGTDSLLNTERIRFADGAIAFDLDGNAGQAFRIYQAAFDRAPDLSGLGFWIAQMDRGVSLQALASSFIQSEEFGDLYGTSLSVDAFVTQLYQNVLHRPAEPDGYTYWFNALKANDTLEMRAAVLASFSEGFENVGQVAQVIAAGIEYIPYV